MTALLNRIIDFSKIDGPGLRTVLVFQGCNFRCLYCHRPDTMGNCDGCGICVTRCPSGALRPRGGKKIALVDDSICFPEFSEKKCSDCGTCINVCAKDATPKIIKVSVKDILERLKKNAAAIEGVTCTGGECLLQGEFMAELFPQAKKITGSAGKPLTCLIDTNGSLFIKKPDSPFGIFDSLRDVEAFPGLADSCDGVFLDIKSADDRIHRELAGGSSGAVLKAAAFLAEKGKLREVRTLVCKQDFAAAETVAAVAKLLAPYLEKTDIAYRLIPFRVYGVRKEHRKLGAPSRARLNELRRIALNNGFRTVFIS
jgi:pyruvate formate lyase activating enzyme